MIKFLQLNVIQLLKWLTGWKNHENSSGVECKIKTPQLCTFEWLPNGVVSETSKWPKSDLKLTLSVENQVLKERVVWHVGQASQQQGLASSIQIASVGTIHKLLLLDRPGGPFITIRCYARGKSLLESWVTTFLPDWQLCLIFVWFISN